ncbi:similar to succinyl-CoA ligase subunit alpha [Plenodomus lingam JN3]|uniref:Similar to succinyl-CoA ligase subunit alpha n=1 Tax=Leptosphaeria maculans (strain JN3 / isolate v23.1.3 / race Av1-4-5-6-7-8) TaxID=985895 RepID=E4ZQL1_LEPMJ|nr:similar to succinyl-CoA ligase subunit alpha [Plenodomus lingam JN3]CBX94016.1 similar to succinyl-CoA ligase subunit alpha [Plenodomus lingam JN3]
MLSQRARCASRNLLYSRSIHLRTKSASFSSSLRYNGYDDTLQNLKIGADTRVIFQGFTGKLATANAKESMEWGTNVVGGVKPNGSGEHLGKPVLPSVRAAMEQLKPDATGIYVAAHQAAAAIEEAIEAEVPLIVAVAEHIPLHDIMRIHSMLQSQSKSRLVGANAPGIISAIGRCRIGFQPLPTFSPGHVGIVAKSGTLSYETVGSLTRAGVGQSLCIAVGGDVMAGTNFIDALKVFETDDDTQAIVLIGELGGTTEEEAAEWIKDYDKRVRNPKPIAAVIGGFQAAPGRVMGHAGAWAGLGEGTAESKYKALESAGVTMVDHPAKFGGVMKEIMAKAGQQIQSSNSSQQRRSYHTTRPTRPSRKTPLILQQKRSLHLTLDQNSTLLKSYNIDVIQEPEGSPSSHYIGISPARSARSPSIIAALTANPSHLHQRVKRFPFDYRQGPTQAVIEAALAHAQLDAAPPKARAQTATLITNLWKLYKEKEAVDAHVCLALSVDTDEILVYNPHLFFDDAAFKSNNRHPDLHSLRPKSSLSPTDLDAEHHGIVYIRLESPPASPSPRNLIGTLVNGAGLAMNTIDILHTRLAPTTTCANFLDTGGKATAHTIKTSFELLLRDPRVAVLFVNIFGGLTRCDMIAEGIVLAYREVGVRKPVVVRLKGTNEEVGGKVLEGAGVPILAVEEFEEAVRRVGELVGRGEGV